MNPTTNIKYRHLCIVIVLLGILLPSLGVAQSTKGRDFWLGFQENFDQSGSLEVYITSEVNTAGTVDIPGLGWTQGFTVAANTTTQVIVPMGAMASGSDVIEAKAIHVTVDDTVGVYMLNYRSASSDAGVVFPTPALGKEYRILTILGWPGDWGVEFMIVATADNTDIEIIPTAATSAGNPAGVPYTITLNAGDLYQVMSSSDLTGTTVEGLPSNGVCNTFAVFVGDKCLNIGGCTACDHIDEEIMPIVTWGTEYITAPFLGKSQDYFRILADEDNTNITINGGAPITLNAGGVYQFANGTPNYISSDKRVMVMQYAQGNDCDGVGDPFQLLISPVVQAIDNITFNAFTSAVISSYYVNVITQTAYTGLCTLDGGPIAFSPVPGNPAYSYAQVSITQGNHTLVSDSGLLGYVYGFGSYESYGYPAGANLSDLTNRFSYFAAITPICPEDTILYTALTDSTVVGWDWDFGDGGTASGQSAIHTYTNFGDYTITLVLNHLGGCSVDTLKKDISVTGPIGTVAGPDTLCGGTNATLTLLGDSSTVSYIWSTGDTTPTIMINPTTTTTYWGAPISASCQGWPDSITVNVIPTLAEFSFDTVCFGDTVFFTDLSASIGDSIVAWLWDFDDGSPLDSAINPYHIYAVGTYNASLSVTTTAGCTAVVTHPISTLSMPDAGFNSLDVCLDNSTSFADTSTDSTGFINVWQWDFGDGIGTASIANPTYLYANSGTYAVSLTVTTTNGCVSTIVEPVEVHPLPLAGYTAITVCASDPTQFIDTSSTGGGVLSNWSWDFGDGDSSFLQNPSHTYDSGGTYNVIFIAFSNYGCSDTATGATDVYFRPVADYSAARVCLGDATAFTEASTVINDVVAAWEWDFDDGSPTVNSSSPTYFYASSGDYNVMLIVTSGNGCQDTMISVVTVDTLPIPNFSFTVVCSYDITEFYDNSTVNGTDYAATWQWDFDDGGTSSQQNPTHDYINSGLYNVGLVVTTNRGCVGNTNLAVRVHPLPSAAFTNTIVCPDVPTYFTDNSTTNVVLWEWDFDDGTTVQGNDPASVNPTHTYDTQGDYQMMLVVTSDSNCLDTVVQTVTVNPKPNPSFTLSPLIITTLMSPYITFENSSTGADSYFWDMGDGFTFVTDSDSTFVHIYSSIDTGTYIIKLIATNIFTCSDSVFDTVIVKGDYTLFVPNAFSPNGDGHNEVFFPAGIALQGMEFEMFIYDRWGDMIYETDDPSKPWDGTANKGAEIAQQDVYIWVIHAIDHSKKKHQYVGHVTLVK